MRVIRRTIKSLIAALLYYSGILSLLARRRLRGKAVVLTYHRVMAPRQRADCHSNPGIIVHNAAFRKHLELLTELFHVLPLGEFATHMKNKTGFPDKSCLITFDDGWVDNHENAFPLLSERDLPATIFLPFNYIGCKLMFWQEELNLRLGMIASSGREEDCKFLSQLTGCTTNTGREYISNYVSQLKRNDYSEINAVLESVRKQQQGISLPQHYDRYLSWDQVIGMQKAGIDFQSHSLSHRILPRLEPDAIERELIDSRRLLETRLGKPVMAIAYPNGDTSPLVESLAEKSGYQLGFTTRKGYVDKNTPEYAIPRINIHNNSSYNKPVFLCTILGIF